MLVVFTHNTQQHEAVRGVYACFKEELLCTFYVGLSMIQWEATKLKDPGRANFVFFEIYDSVAILFK